MFAIVCTEVEDGDLDDEDMEMQLKLLSLVDDPAVVVAAAAAGETAALKSFLAGHPGSVSACGLLLLFCICCLFCLYIRAMNCKT